MNLYFYISNNNYNIKTHQLIDNNINTNELLLCIDKNEFSNYRAIYNKKHSETQSILLRDQNKNITIDCVKYYPIFRFLHKIIKKNNGTLYSSSIIYLPKNKSVKKHKDGIRNNILISNYYTDKDRYHLVLSGQYQYNVNNISKIYKKGDLWWFNNKLQHSAKAITDRIVLVFDIKKNIKNRKNYGYHLCIGKWSIYENIINKIDISKIIKLITNKNIKEKLIDHKEISWKSKYNPEEKFDKRYIDCDESFPGILCENVKNPENLKYRMIDGSHRITKLRKKHNIKKSFFYIITKKDFYNYLEY